MSDKEITKEELMEQRKQLQDQVSQLTVTLQSTNEVLRRTLGEKADLQVNVVTMEKATQNLIQANAGLRKEVEDLEKQEDISVQVPPPEPEKK